MTARRFLPLVFILLLVPHASTEPRHAETLEQRLTRLEDFMQQQRDYNHESSDRLTRQLDDVLRQQGTQQERIGGLADRQRAVDTVGGIFVLMLSLFTPIIWSASARRHKEQREMHRENLASLSSLQHQLSDLDLAVTKLQTVCEMLNIGPAKEYYRREPAIEPIRPRGGASRPEGSSS